MGSLVEVGSKMFFQEQIGELVSYVSDIKIVSYIN